MRDIPCNVICDLIPLVKDGVASKESEEMVTEHIEHCKSCRRELDAFETIALDTPSPDDERVINLIKRNIYISKMAILILGGIVGLALTGTMGQFYNLIIMPIVGGLSLIVLKDRWHLGFISVFALSYLGQIIYFIFSNQFTWGVLIGSIFYGMIYIVLMALGMFIWILLRFAFGKEANSYGRRQ